MDQSSILSVISTVISVGAMILVVINHKRIRSNCCGNKGEVSLDIESTSPQIVSYNPEVTPATLADSKAGSKKGNQPV